MFLYGLGLSLCGYVIWGLAPLFWKQITHIPTMLLLYHRVLVAFLILLLVLLPRLLKKKNEIRKHIKPLIFTSILILCNWFIFVWAILENRILETSLGYYINPFINLIVGYFLLQEKLTKRQSLAVVFAAVGVAMITYAVGSLPWVSLLLAATFSCYGFIHKKIPLRADVSLFTETLILSPFMLVSTYLHPDTASVYADTSNYIWLFLTGLITVVPLICFIQGVKYIPLGLTGILQFLAPSMTFYIAVFVYNESFTYIQLLGFILIWTSILFYVYDAIRKRVKINKRS